MDILKRREYYKKWYYSRRIGQNQEINNLPYEEWKDVVFDRFGNIMISLANINYQTMVA